MESHAARRERERDRGIAERREDGERRRAPAAASVRVVPRCVCPAREEETHTRTRPPLHIEAKARALHIPSNTTPNTTKTVFSAHKQKHTPHKYTHTYTTHHLSVFSCFVYLYAPSPPLPLLPTVPSFFDSAGFSWPRQRDPRWRPLVPVSRKRDMGGGGRNTRCLFPPFLFLPLAPKMFGGGGFFCLVSWPH